MKQKLKDLMADYGRTAIWVYLSIFALSIATFTVSLQLGFEVDGAAGTTGTLAAAYLATKAIQPLRIAATVALTPLAAAAVARVRGQPVPVPARSQDSEQ
jgi:hypothetical protein